MKTSRWHVTQTTKFITDIQLLAFSRQNLKKDLRQATPISDSGISHYTPQKEQEKWRLTC